MYASFTFYLIFYLCIFSSSHLFFLFPLTFMQLYVTVYILYYFAILVDTRNKDVILYFWYITNVTVKVGKIYSIFQY